MNSSDHDPLLDDVLGWDTKPLDPERHEKFFNELFKRHTKCKRKYDVTIGLSDNKNFGMSEGMSNGDYDSKTLGSFNESIDGLSDGKTIISSQGMPKDSFDEGSSDGNVSSPVAAATVTPAPKGSSDGNVASPVAAATVTPASTPVFASLLNNV